jgi:hypothetical protein
VVKRFFLIRILLALKFVFVVGGVCSAQEDENRNALPPGSARISGYITQGGQPVSEATVRMKCRYQGKSLKRDFKTYGRGEYTVYIPDTAKKVVLILFIEGKEEARFEPDNWGEGTVSRKDWVVE